MNEMESIESPSSFSYGMRAIATFALTALAATLGLLLSRSLVLSQAFFWHNTLDTATRLRLVAGPFAAAALASVFAIAVWWLTARRGWNLTRQLWRLSLTLSPVGPLAFAPVFLQWAVWQDHDLVFLLLVLVEVLAFKATLSAAVEARPLELLWSRSQTGESDNPSGTRGRSLWGRVKAAVSWPNTGLAIVVLASLYYTIWFSYYTTIWHLSARSGWDLSIEDNILWNIVHGGRFFHAAPALGPTGSHFRRHAALIAYVLAPFYALHQSSEMVLILQSALQGLAAIPLFLFARRRLGDATAAIIAIAYLLHPALQESNLFEAHYVKFGPLPFFTTLWLLDAQRTRAAIVAACLTLAVREDVATWVVLLGLWGIFADKSRRASIFITILSCVYVALVKFVVMPALAGGQDELAFMYRDLIPPGKSSFAWAMVTVVTNPAYFVRSLFEMEKLVYFLQVLVPLALLPLTRKIGWLALIPGTVYSLMETQYHPLVDIHFQYSPHFLAFLFPALVFVLEKRRRWSFDHSSASGVVEEPHSNAKLDARRVGALGAIVLGTLLCSYQYGPMFQQNNSRGGPIPYKFGWDKEGRERHEALVALKEILPDRAKVAASAFTVTQISSRPEGYSLSMSLYDADWIIAPTSRSELLPDERVRAAEVLRSGVFGVVAIRHPFFLAKRGYPTHQNAAVLATIGP